MGKSFARVANRATGVLIDATGVLIVRARAACAPGVSMLAAFAAFAACAPGAASALDNTGGTAAPAAVVSTSGTGGAIYRAAVPKPRTVRKAVAHAPARKPVKHAPARRPAKPKTTPVPAATPSGAPTPAQTVAQGAIFPVSGPHSFGGPENRFGAGRVGHVHQGQDVLASEGLPVLAPLAGAIVTTGYQAGGAGWYVAEQTGDGLSFFFAHCEAGSVGVKPEASVRAGQQLCLVGQTGDATGPHLHFEIWVGGWRVGNGYPIDPLPYLEDWDR
jgi:murein DD-endopeptidase MepM/ murein hydrolase activator NlpD